MLIVLADLSTMPLQDTYLLAGIILVGLFLARRGWVAQKNAPRGTDYRTLAAEVEQRQDFDLLAVRLEEVFREMNGKLDTKMIALNQLLLETDGKIAELKRLQPSKSTGNASASAEHDPSGDTPLIIDMEAESGPELRKFPHSEIFALVDRGESAAAISDKLDVPLAEVELIIALRRRRGDRLQKVAARG